MPQIVRAMAWMAAGGFTLCAMNGVMRIMTQQLDPLQSQFLRYVFGLLVMLPWVMRSGLGAYWPNNMTGQWVRGAAHTAALALFFLALPHIPLADATAIGFTTPIFVLVGAALALREKVSPARWLAAGVGFAGVLIVVAPHLSGHGAGWWSLVMLAASPLFAASFLINKALTRRDKPETIVFWQNISVTLLTLPLALPGWRDPTLVQWGTFLLCGVLGTVAHLCMTPRLQPGRHLRDAAGALPRPDLGGAARPGAVRRPALGHRAAGRSRDPRLDDVDRAARSRQTLTGAGP